jgi:hypothetical protein
MPKEVYPCYVRISEGPESEEVIELPTESDGRLLLTTITAQYPNAIGLRFKSESGAWRGMRFIDGALEPPLEGWGYNDYFITTAVKTVEKATKRKLETADGPASSRSKIELLSDMIVLGLPYSATEDDLKNYFEKFGELSHYEIKMDSQTKKSKGFGFIRFKKEESAKEVLEESHSMGGRNLDVRFPYKHGPYQDNIPTKLFIGRLARGTTVEELRDHFNDYGPLKDVYIPQNFRGFGFVTFASQGAAQQAMNTTHELKGSYLNLSFPQPKPGATPAYGDGAAAQPGMMPGAAAAHHVDPYNRGTTGSDNKPTVAGGYYNTAAAYPYHHQQIGPQQPVRWNR